MRPLSPREELIQIQKRIFKKNQKIIEDSIAIREEGFLRYEQAYLRHVNSFQSPATIQELKFELAKARWIYLGDYHTNPQAQRTLLRILKLLITQTDRFVIALELLKSHQQRNVDRYLAGEISKEAFLKRINLRKHFHFDLWENFEPIFDLARHYQIKVYGIESAPFGSGLVKRDQAMARALAKIARQHPEDKILTFVGDLHIAPPHLPLQVKKVRGDEGRELFLYQNSEKIYWKLAHAKMEEKVEVVRIDENSFCLMNTPPIVCQQTYLNWLQEEEGEIDYHDPKHSFVELAESIAGFLGVILPPSKEEVEVFTSGDLSFLERLKDDPDFTAEERREIKRQVMQARSYLVAKNRWVYLANMATNHAAEEATRWIRSLIAPRQELPTAEDRFYAHALGEALGFFGSKIINPKRKCLRLKDFRSMTDYFRMQRVPRGRSLELEIARGVLEAKRLERKGLPIANPKFLQRRRDLFAGIGEALGNMLGEILYHAMVQEKLKKSAIKALLKRHFLKAGEPWQAYRGLIAAYGKTPLPHRL